MFNPLNRTYFITPPESILGAGLNCKDAPAPYYSAETIRAALTDECGLPCYLFKPEAPSPLYCTYYFNLTSHLDWAKIDKALAHLSVARALHLTRLKETEGAMFAIRIDNPRGAPVNFNSALGIDYPNQFTAFLGLGPNYRPVLVNLLDSPHILLAGATGAGKSTALNTMLCSLLMRAQPNELGLILIDPKVVELAPYEGVPHQQGFAHNLAEARELLKKVSGPLIDMLYKRLKARGVKSVAELPLNEQGHYLVVIDEYADLILADPTIGDYVARIAQMGRACGVHLLIATQRPTVKVLDGLIKANLTTRIALKTASIRDAQNILDHKGAEDLKGRGDALVKMPSEVSELRVQCANITTAQINAVTDYWKRQVSDPNFPPDIDAPK